MNESRVRTALVAAAILAVNLTVAWKLFGVEYSAHLNSNEGTFIAIARVMAEHPGERLWWPFWDCGLPFQNTYLPLLHMLVALAVRVTGLSPAHAFHAVCAALYCLGPVAVFWLGRAMSGRLWPAALAALLYSLVSPSAILSPVIRGDVGGLWNLRRLSVLVSYGEGPPTAGLLFLPLAILFVYLLLKRHSGVYAALAGLALAAAVLSNAFTGVAAAMAAVSLLASVETRRFPRNLIMLAAVGMAAYCLISPWLPPSLIAAIRTNSPTVDGDYRYTSREYIALAAVVAGYVAAWWGSCRAALGGHLRFSILFSYLAAAVTLLGLEYRINILPQAHRYQIVMDMALSLLAAFVAATFFDRLPRRARMVCVALIAAALARQGVHGVKYARGLIRSTGITHSVEYKMARWMDQNRRGQRAMMPGSVSFLYNVFTSNPQLHGGHDPMLPNALMRAVVFSLYSDMNAGDRAAEVSVTWLKAFGAQAIGVSGSHGREFYKPFAHPDKFEGVLPVIWREGDDRIYGVPARSRSLAHVIPAPAVVARTPIHGLDIEPVQAYVRALDDPALPEAVLEWKGLHRASVRVAGMRPGQVLSV